MRSNRQTFAFLSITTILGCAAAACGGSNDTTIPDDSGAVVDARSPGDSSETSDGEAKSDDSGRPVDRDDASTDAGGDAEPDASLETHDAAADASDATVDEIDAADGAAWSEDASDATVDATLGDDASDAGLDAGVDATLTQDASSDDAAADSAVPAVVNFVAGVTVSTIAGSNTAGEQDGIGDAALFDNPTGIAIDHDGNLLVVDYDGWTVRVVTPQGAVRTVGRGDSFGRPFAATVGDNGTYFVSTDDDPNDGGNKTATSGAVWSVVSYDGGVVAPTPLATTLSRPRGLTNASDGGLFVVSRYLGIVERLDPSSGAIQFIAGGGDAGFSDGTGAQAYFNSPIGTTRLPDGSWAVADASNSRIRIVTPGGAVTTLAGDGTSAMVDGACASAHFTAPHAIASDAAGNLYVSDSQRIRRIRTTGGCVVETLAGNGATDFADGPGDQAAFYGAEGLDVTADGTTVYVADGDLGAGTSYHRIRAITIP